MVADEQFALLHRVLAEFLKASSSSTFWESIRLRTFIGRRDEEQTSATYKRVDAEIGRVLQEHPGVTMIVMSDHGFSEFRRAVNVNTWLMREGFLTLDFPSTPETTKALRTSTGRPPRLIPRG